MADIAYEIGDENLKETCHTLFEDITKRKMYITGGVGSSWRGESFSIPYVMPNKKAYNETCALISLMFFAQRMMKLENNAVYADVIERVLYNGFLSGLSLDGKKFFYENPLEIDSTDREKEPEEHFLETPAEHIPITQRVEVFDCSCCPPNINRFLSKLGEYVYAKDGDTYYVNQIARSRMNDGTSTIIQSTDYPCSGKIKLGCTNIKRIAVRKPEWCTDFSADVKFKIENGYIMIESPESFTIDFRMQPKLIMANKKVHNLNGRVAVTMGPIVYCCESVDNGGDLRSLFIDAENPEYSVEYDEKFGLNIISVNGFKRDDNNELYFEYKNDLTPVKIKLIPYNCFANRGESDFLVWLNLK